MKQDEAQKVLQIMQPLDQFTGSSNTLNTHRAWHSTWVQLFTQCAQQIAAMVDKPEDKAEKPEVKLARVKGEIAKLERQRAEVVQQIGIDTSGSGLDPAKKLTKPVPKPPPPPPNETTTKGPPPEPEPETDEESPAGELIDAPPDETKTRGMGGPSMRTCRGRRG